MCSEGPGESVEVFALQPIRRSAVNLVALASIQVANAIVPLVIYPLILGVVGAERFSRLVVTESVILVVVAIIIFSFDVEGVSHIAALDPRGDIAAISEVFSEIFTTRTLILGGCVVLVAASALFVDRMTFLLLAGWMLLPLSYLLQSTWFFLAIERNGFVASVVVVTRLGCLLLVHLLIATPDDVLLAPIIIGGSYTVAGAVILGYAISVQGVRLHPVSLGRVRAALARGRHIFVGGLSVTLYRGSNVLLLSWISTSRAVVVYSIAEKTIKVLQAGAGPLNQVFYPRVIRALGSMREPSHAARRIVARYTVPQLLMLAGGTAAAGVVLIFFRRALPAPFRSSQATDIIVLIVMMLPAVFLGVANFMFGTGGLNYLGRRPYLAKALLATGLGNLVVCATLAGLFSASGAAVSYVLAELTLFLLIIRAYRGRDRDAQPSAASVAG